jgi:hypothetical protein
MAASDLYEKEGKTEVTEERTILSSDVDNRMKDIVTARYKYDRKHKLLM